jgi:hypothetical protein
MSLEFYTTNSGKGDAAAAKIACRA